MDAGLVAVVPNRPPTLAPENAPKIVPLLLNVPMDAEPVMEPPTLPTRTPNSPAIVPVALLVRLPTEPATRMPAPPVIRPLLVSVPIDALVEPGPLRLPMTIPMLPLIVPLVSLVRLAIEPALKMPLPPTCSHRSCRYLCNVPMTPVDWLYRAAIVTPLE